MIKNEKVVDIDNNDGMVNDKYNESFKENDMSFKKSGRTYYKTKVEAAAIRRKWDRIYFDPDVGAYYIVRPKKRSFWGF